MNVSRQKDFERTLCRRVKTNWSSAQIGEEVVSVYTRHIHLFARSTTPEKKRKKTFKHMEKNTITIYRFFENIFASQSARVKQCIFNITGLKKKIAKIRWITY